MRRRQVRSAPRRKLVWARVTFDTALAVPVAAGQNFGVPATVDALSEFKTALGAAPIGVTVMRIRGILAATSLSAAATTSVRFGMRVGDIGDVATTQQAANMFSLTGEAQDWMLYEPLFASSAAGAVNAFVGGDLGARVIDVKSHRKLEEISETLILNLSGQSTVATNLSFHADLSVLLALP